MPQVSATAPLMSSGTHWGGGPLSPPTPVEAVVVVAGAPPLPVGQVKLSRHSAGNVPQPAPSESHPASVEPAMTIPQSAVRIRTSPSFELPECKLDRVSYLKARAGA